MSWWDISPCFSLTSPKFSAKILKWEWKRCTLIDAVVFSYFFKFSNFCFLRNIYLKALHAANLNHFFNKDLIKLLIPQYFAQITENLFSF